MPTYTLSVQPYLDQHNKCYQKIITINVKPIGPLSKYVKLIHPPKLSPFKENSPCCTQENCVYVITHISSDSSNSSNCCNNFMYIDDIPNLFSFLTSNGYTIDSNLTKIMQKSDVRLSNNLLCFISI